MKMNHIEQDVSLTKKCTTKKFGCGTWVNKTRVPDLYEKYE